MNLARCSCGVHWDDDETSTVDSVKSMVKHWRDGHTVTHEPGQFRRIAKIARVVAMFRAKTDDEQMETS